MSRRNAEAGLGDSFDLFLDTITNTFGGVLLIALLIALLIRDAPENQDLSSQAISTTQAAQISADIKALQSERQMLQQSLAAAELMESEFKNEELSDLANQLKPLASKRAQLKNELAAVEQDVDSLSKQKSEMQSEQEITRNRLADTESALQDMRRQLDKEKAKRTRTMSLPKESPTVKREVPVVLKQGKLYPVVTNLTALSPSVDTRYFESASRSDADINLDSRYWKTRANKGIPPTVASLKTEFSKYPASQFYLAIVTRSDSFSQFQNLRQSVVELGYEYRIIPTDGVIGQGGSGGARTQ